MTRLYFFLAFFQWAFFSVFFFFLNQSITGQISSANWVSIDVAVVLVRLPTLAVQLAEASLAKSSWTVLQMRERDNSDFDVHC